MTRKCCKIAYDCLKYDMTTCSDNGNDNIKPCPAELFQLYFSSFGAEIANAISNSK